MLFYILLQFDIFTAFQNYVKILYNITVKCCKLLLFLQWSSYYKKCFYISFVFYRRKPYMVFEQTIPLSDSPPLFIIYISILSITSQKNLPRAYRISALSCLNRTSSLGKCYLKDFPSLCEAGTFPKSSQWNGVSSILWPLTHGWANTEPLIPLLSRFL